jgi:CheY-like chemotaxis protein
MDQAGLEVVDTGAEVPSEAPSGAPKILLVDDDWSVLEAFQRQFAKNYNVHVAVGPTVGIQTLEQHGPFELVIADLQMPVMNGIQLLSLVRSRWPETIRILLTGPCDFSMAIAAVNQAHIFRFLVKPCPPPVLERVVRAALEQANATREEKQLAQSTLLGCVRMMVDVLSIVHPQACGRANRIRRLVAEIASAMHPGAACPWEYEAAAMLSQIAWIAVPADLLDKSARGELTQEEAKRLSSQSAATARMVGEIPRLEVVAKILTGFTVPFSAMPEFDTAPAATGAQVLKVALEFDDLRQRGVSHDDAVAKMTARAGRYNPQVLSSMDAIKCSEQGDGLLDVRFADLAPHMVLEEDIVGSHGLCVVGKGQELTESTILRLSGFASLVPPDRICKVRMHR